MEVANIKKALRRHRMESNKSKLDFNDISNFDIVPTPPKEPKPEATKLHRRHRIRAKHFDTHETKYGCSLDSEIQLSRLEPGTKSGCNDSIKANDPAFPWYCPTPTPRTGNPSFDEKEKAIHKQASYNDAKPLRPINEKPPRKCRNEVANTNPIRYPAPGPREQLAPSPFPVNKNKLPPVVNPKKKLAPKPARVGPRPIKAKHMPLYQENTESNSMLTQMYGCRDDYVPDSVIPAMKNSHPIRYPSPGPRERLLPNNFPVNKRSLPPVITRRRVVPPMCG